jgi:hypothetical protein
MFNNRDGSIIANTGVVTFLKTITTAVCLHKNGKVALDIIRLNI